jgi:hypothetical protein
MASTRVDMALLRSNNVELRLIAELSGFGYAVLRLGSRLVHRGELVSTTLWALKALSERGVA